MQATRHKWLAVGVVALSAFLRLSQLATIPFGWHPDEATKALLARDVLNGRYFPPFFSAFTGREALFVYLEALFFGLMGESIFIGRLISAFVGILTVALTYATFRTLFNRRVALLTAAFLATSLWHIIASRNGYRAVIQPLIQLPAIWLLFVGWQKVARSEWRIASKRPTPYALLPPFIVAGLFLGFTQYTYTAVRIFPFLIVAIVLLGLVVARKVVWSSKWLLAATAVTAFLIFLPLGWYFFHNPTDFYGRAAQISVFSPEWAGGDPQARLWQSVKETARMFTIWGDINYRFNIAGQPVFGWLDGLLFYIGLLLCGWGAYRHSGLKRLAYLTIPVWVLLLLLPMFLSAESLPYYQRAIGALPAVYLFPALTLERLFTIKIPKLSLAPPFSILHSPFSILLLLFTFLTLRTYQNYFTDWHLSPRNDDDRRVAMVYVADYVNSHPFTEKLYLSTQYPQHPTLALLSQEKYDAVHWFNAQQSLPLPAPDDTATYILLRENAPQPALLDRVGLRWVETAVDRFARPVFDVYRWDGASPYPAPSDQSPAAWSWATSFPADGDWRNPIDLPVNFADTMWLMGHDRNGSTFAPGAVVELILYWELGGRQQRPLTIFSHILNSDGQLVAGFDANDYPAVFWHENGGERLLSYFPLALPPDLPAGEYQIEIGVYDQPTGERLAILDGTTAVEATPVADRLLLAPITIE